MANTLPPELARLLEASGPSSIDESWSAFVSKYNRLIFHTARRFGGDYDSAMDRYTYILEELRRDEFKRLRRYVADRRSQFSTWLVVVARRLCLDYQRHKYGRSGGSGSMAAERAEREARRRLVDLVAEQIDLANVADRSGENPEISLRSTQLAEALQAAIRALAPQDQLLLTLRFEDEVPVREIADVMGFRNVFQVYRRLDSLFKSVRTELEARGVEEATP